MTHNFNTGIAKVVGVYEAVFISHLFFWIQKNYGNGKHFYDGSCWTYNSVRGFNIIFDYLTPNQIRRVLDNLIDGGYIKTGNYNTNKIDRTMWYAFTDKGLKLLNDNGYKFDNSDNQTEQESPFVKNHKCICEKPQMDLEKTTNAFNENHKCTYTDNIVTDISNTDVKVEENTPTQAEKKKSSSAKQKKDMVLDSNNRLMDAADPASRYGRFMKWAAQTIPDCYATMAMPTENQLATLMSTYGDSAVIDIFETIENRQDIRGKYKSLYLTAKNWLKRDEQKKQ